MLPRFVLQILFVRKSGELNYLHGVILLISLNLVLFYASILVNLSAINAA